MKHTEFLSRIEYFDTVTRLAGQAMPGERVLIATMDFSPEDQHIAQLLSALLLASKRGARVVCIVDAISLLISDHGLPVFSVSRHKLRTAPGSLAARHRALEELRAAGAECHIINVSKRRVGLIQQGRSHIKCAVIGNDLFVGGCNLTRPEQIDVMIHRNDQPAADILAGWLRRIADTEQTRDALGDVDVAAQLDDQTSLLLDAGVPKQSLIYEEALALIDTAERSVYITCQYFPGGETARHLAAAQARGVAVTINFSHPSAHGHAATLHQLHQLRQRARKLPSTFFAGRLNRNLPKLHAKVLISEKAALVGSHNYVVQGVNFGTAEIALKSTDPAFGSQLRSFIEQQINNLGK